MDNFAVQLMDLFWERYRRIWVQRGKYSLCITLFPIEGHYTILTRKNIYHGYAQEVNFEDVLELVNEYHNGQK